MQHVAEEAASGLFSANAFANFAAPGRKVIHPDAVFLFECFRDRIVCIF